MQSAAYRSAIALMVVSIWAGAAGAQPLVSSIEELKVLAATGSPVTVTDTNGLKVTGSIAEASATMLSVQTSRGVRQFDAVDVRAVSVRKEDSLKNGLLIGAATAGGLTSLLFLDNECHNDSACFVAVGTYAGVGALVGAGIDALIRRSVVVYRSPERPRVLTVAPIIGDGRRGVHLRFEF